jgi:hypothetical protein
MTDWRVADWRGLLSMIFMFDDSCFGRNFLFQSEGLPEGNRPKQSTLSALKKLAHSNFSDRVRSKNLRRCPKCLNTPWHTSQGLWLNFKLTVTYDRMLSSDPGIIKGWPTVKRKLFGMKGVGEVQEGFHSLTWRTAFPTLRSQ